MRTLHFRVDGSFPITCRTVSTTTLSISKPVNSPSLTLPGRFTFRRQRDLSTLTRTVMSEAEGHERFLRNSFSERMETRSSQPKCPNDIGSTKWTVIGDREKIHLNE